MMEWHNIAELQNDMMVLQNDIIKLQNGTSASQNGMLPTTHPTMRLSFF